MKQIVLGFLSGLAENNNREWFQQNKRGYEEAKAEVEMFVNSIIPGIGAFDDTVKYVEAKECIFRIFRDVRFSKDKSPYKVNMGAWITPAGRKGPGPGYYIHFQPGESFLAGGVYMPEPAQLKRIRSEIYYNAAEFKSILEEKELKKYCDGLSDFDKAKAAPRDFPKDFPDIDLLKHRHYTVTCLLKEEMILSEKLHAIVLKAFRAMHPLNTFLKRALDP
jgi:uncharacterized protein (TIGR02453 family)